MIDELPRMAVKGRGAVGAPKHRFTTREQVAIDVKPRGAEVVGRYALQIRWSDQHSTGMYHFDRLFEICAAWGSRLG